MVWTTTGSSGANPTGNVFVADWNLNEVVESTWGGSSWSDLSSPMTTGLSHPTRVAVDGSGNVYIANEQSNEVVEASWTGSGWSTATTVSTTQLNMPEDVAVDSHGGIYIADFGNNRLVRESYGAVTFGSVPAGTSTAKISTFFAFGTPGILGSVAVLTQGATGLDFANAHTGSCSPGHSYNAGDVCTIDVTFTPRYAGTRYGTAVLKDASGNALATAYLYGLGTGPQIAFAPVDKNGAPLSESVLTVSGTANPAPVGIATDAAGNVYVADFANKQVVKLSPVPGGGINQLVVASGLGGPRGIAADGAGNVYVADMDGGQLYEVPWNGSGYLAPIPLLPSGTHSPAVVAVDGNGNIFFTDALTAYAGVIQGGSLSPLTLPPGLTPAGLAFDSAGDLFITDYAGNSVVELPAANSPWTASWGSPVTVYSGSLLSAPARFGIDASGTLYIADTGNHRVARISCTSTAVDLCTSWGDPATVVTGMSVSDTAYDAALDGAGNLYIPVFTGTPRLLKEDYTDAPSLTFAITELSLYDTVTSPQTVTIGNIGNANLTTQGAPSVPTDFDFTHSGLTTCAVLAGSGTLTPGQTCDLSVTFNPWHPGNPLEESLTLTDNNLNAPGATQSIQFTGTAYAPAALLTPSSLTFGNQTEYSTSTPWTVNLTNNSNTRLLISSISIGGADASVFSIQSKTCGTELAGNSSCSISITFTPSGARDFAATLSVSDNAMGSPQSIPLTGTGTGLNAFLAPASLNFVNQTAGVTSSAQQVSLTNSSNGALTITGITFGGADASLFSQTNNCGTTLAGNSSCNIQVTFTPTAAGTFKATLLANDDAPGSPQSIPLNGTVTGASALLTPSSLTFGNQTEYSTSTPWTVNLTNNSSASLSIASISIGGADASAFSIQSQTSRSTLAGNSSCSISITFTPSGVRSFAARLSVSDDAPGSPQSIPLTGTGTALVANLAPASLNFVNQTAGVVSSAQQVSLTNSSNGALTISGITIGGADPSQFSQTNNCGTTLAGNSSCTIQVTFTPTAAGTFRATLSANDNAPGSPQSIPLVGTAVPQAQIINFNLASPIRFPVAPITLSATASSGLPVTFSLLSGPANLAGNVLTITGAGTVVVAANQTGNATYESAPQVTVSLTVTPRIDSLSPPNKIAGSSGFTLTVTGAGFDASSTVYWNTVALTTSYVDSKTLTAQVPSSDIATAGTSSISVNAPGLGTSNSLTFQIDSGSNITPPAFATATATVTAGTSASYSVTIPSSATNISVSCLNLPSGTTCSYLPSTSTVTIKTSSSTPSGTYQIVIVFTETLPGAASGFVFLPILLLPLTSARRRKALLGRISFLVCLGLVLLALASGGCSGGGSGNGSNPPAQTHTVTSSGAVLLTVQ